jgi:signal peptidase II
MPHSAMFKKPVQAARLPIQSARFGTGHQMREDVQQEQRKQGWFTRSRRRWLLLLAIVLAVLLVDQVTKRIIVERLQLGQTIQPIEALVPFFQVTYSLNTGAAFGFLPEAGDLFLIIAIIVVIVMFFYYPRLPDAAGLTRIGLGLICGGALGNAIDRLTYGHVVDFIHYQIPGVISNVSNLADHAIVLGVILVLIESIRLDRLMQQQEAAKQAAEAEANSGGTAPSDTPQFQVHSDRSERVDR